MLTLRGGNGEWLNVEDYTWDAGQPEPTELCTGIISMVGLFKCELRGINSRQIRRIFKGAWASTSQPDRPHCIDIEIQETNPLGKTTVIKFGWFRWMNMDVEDNVVKIEGIYLVEDY